MSLLRSLAYCIRLRYSDTRSVAQIHDLQLKRLRQAVRFAKARSVFFNNHYRFVDPDAPDFSVRSLPPVTKEMMMENFDQVVTDPRLKLAEVKAWAKNPNNLGRLFLGRYIVAHTSGTTGMHAFFVYDRREWDWLHAMSVTRGLRYKPSLWAMLKGGAYVLTRPIKIALIGLLGGHYATFLVFLVVPRVVRTTTRFSHLSVMKPTADLVAQLNRFQPNILHGYPTVLEVLAYEQVAGRLKIDPQVLTASSEPLTQNARKVIHGAFPNCEIFETYGSTEGLTIAAECHEHRGMHINNDHFILESVRADGQPTTPGQAGEKVYLSNLNSRIMPRLRYEMGDVTVPLAETCGCGLPFPMIKVRGRADDIFWVQDKDQNLVALPPIPLEGVFLGVVGLRQYQLIQEERNRLRILFRPAEGTDPAHLKAEIEARFTHFFQEKRLDGCVTFKVEQVAEIARDPKSGKIRQIFSRVERPYVPGMALGDRRSGEDRRADHLKVAQGERRQGRRMGEGPETPKPEGS